MAQAARTHITESLACVTAAAPAVAHPGPDPIFAAIARDRAAEQALADADRAYDGSNVMGLPSDDPLWEMDRTAREMMYATVPTTLAGAAAKIERVKEIERTFGGYPSTEHLCDILDHLLPRGDLTLASEFSPPASGEERDY